MKTAEAIGQYTLGCIIAVLMYKGCETHDQHAHELQLLERKHALSVGNDGELPTCSTLTNTDVYEPWFSRRWRVGERWEGAYLAISREAEIRFGTNLVIIPAGSDIDITFGKPAAIKTNPHAMTLQWVEGGAK